MTAMRVNLPYLSEDRGMIYVRRHGRRIRIREKPGTPEFTAAYNAALDALDGLRSGTRAAPVSHPKGTFGWLAARYFASAEFRNLAAKSQATRRGVIEQCLAEPLRPGSTKRMGDVPLSAFNASHVRALRDRKQGQPGAANNRKKYLSAMFGWAVEAGHLAANPARDVRRQKYATEGFYTWTVDDVRAFEARHPVGTKARLALALLLYTGVRRQDLVVLGRQHVRGGYLRFVPQKTRYRRAMPIELPILPVLQDIIAASPTGDLTFLVTEYGQPFSAAGFGAWFRKRCDEAGLHHCTAHGLRKAGATLAAEAGATDRQLMALYGWTSASQATVYTATADRKRMASEAAALLAKTGTNETIDPPPKLSHADKNHVQSTAYEGGGRSGGATKSEKCQ